MYQAMDHMPVTGFNRNDRLTHTKRLLTFAFSNESFEACMLQSVEMRNEFLQHIYQSTTWEALQELVKEPEETEEKTKKEKEKLVIRTHLFPSFHQVMCRFVDTIGFL
ncbi:hypothetical protein ACT7DB_30815 [Bacillus cereus]